MMPSLTRSRRLYPSIARPTYRKTRRTPHRASSECLQPGSACERPQTLLTSENIDVRTLKSLIEKRFDRRARIPRVSDSLHDALSWIRNEAVGARPYRWPFSVLRCCSHRLSGTCETCHLIGVTCDGLARYHGRSIDACRDRPTARHDRRLPRRSKQPNTPSGMRRFAGS